MQKSNGKNHDLNKAQRQINLSFCSQQGALGEAVYTTIDIALVAIMVII
jgi:hypothetical protein